MLIKVPTTFLFDHQDRDLPTPVIIRTVGSRAVIDTDDGAFAELVHDARHYAEGGTDADRWLVTSARALLKAIDRQMANPAQDQNGGAPPSRGP